MGSHHPQQDRATRLYEALRKSPLWGAIGGVRWEVSEKGLPLLEGLPEYVSIDTIRPKWVIPENAVGNLFGIYIYVDPKIGGSLIHLTNADGSYVDLMDLT